MISGFASHLTVKTSLGEREFRSIYAEVKDGVLVITRDHVTLSWFAAGQWTEVSFL